MNSLLLWLNFHRFLVICCVGVGTWLAAYGLYFRTQLQPWLFKGRAHSWSVDLASKTATARGKPETG